MLAILHKSKSNYYIRDGRNGKILKALGPITKEEGKEQVAIWRQETAKLEEWKSRILPMPDGQFDIIYADPPWRYDTKYSNRKIENHYPTMELQDICDIKVPAADDSILFLWATVPKLVEAMAVIKAWGFSYRTNIVWVKNKIGMGFYFRGRHELLLLATKGHPLVPATADRNDSVIFGEPTEHSKKPDVVYTLIESAFPGRTYLEMFARQKYSEKWKTWGNQIISSH